MQQVRKRLFQKKKPHRKPTTSKLMAMWPMIPTRLYSGSSLRRLKAPFHMEPPWYQVVGLSSNTIVALIRNSEEKAGICMHARTLDLVYWRQMDLVKGGAVSSLNASAHMYSICFWSYLDDALIDYFKQRSLPRHEESMPRPLLQ